MDPDDRADDLARAERAADDALAATVVRHLAVLALATGATTIGLLSVMGVVVGVVLHLTGVTTLSTAALMCLGLFAVVVVAEIATRVARRRLVAARGVSRVVHAAVSGVATATAVVMLVDALPSLGAGGAGALGWALVAGGTVAVLVARRPFWMERTTALLDFVSGRSRP